MEMVLFFAYFSHIIRAPAHRSLGSTTCCYGILLVYLGGERLHFPRGACVGRRRRPRLALDRQLVLHSRPLIYGGRIKRHGLYRSAVAFLYSHRHSWGTAGWSGKRFMSPHPCGVLKTLASAAATSSSSKQNTDTVRPAGQSRASPEAQHHVWSRSSAAPSRTDNVDTTDTLWRLLVKNTPPPQTQPPKKDILFHDKHTYISHELCPLICTSCDIRNSNAKFASKLVPPNPPPPPRATPKRGHLLGLTSWFGLLSTGHTR